MPHSTLIDTASLAKCLSDPDVVLVDCRFQLDVPDWGERVYNEGHIPGAVYAHLNRDLSGPPTGRNGRHPLPAIDTFAATVGRLGIGPGMQVIAYDQDVGAWAARLWWMLRWMGHDAVAVLDGGWDAWIREGRPTRSGSERHHPRTFVPRPREAMVADVEFVERIVAGSVRATVIDSRASERYRGEVEPIDRVPGHVPGARNHPFRNNVDASGRFLPPEALRDQFDATLAGTAAGEPLVVYCGSGVTACQNLLALERAGLTGARLYPGSWSEWSSDPDRPIAKGGRP